MNEIRENSNEFPTEPDPHSPNIQNILTFVEGANMQNIDKILHAWARGDRQSEIFKITAITETANRSIIVSVGDVNLGHSEILKIELRAMSREDLVSEVKNAALRKNPGSSTAVQGAFVLLEDGKVVIKEESVVFGPFDDSTSASVSSFLNNRLRNARTFCDISGALRKSTDNSFTPGVAAFSMTTPGVLC